MKTFNNLLTELPLNQIYKDFKKSDGQPIQLPLPFEFTDEFFESKKEQVNHILRTMHGMKIGYEFEIYLPKQIDDSANYETADLSDVYKNYYWELEQLFAHESNRQAYNKLDAAYLEWMSDAIYSDIDARLDDEGIIDGDPEYDYDEEREKMYNLMSDEDTYSFDEYVGQEYYGNLLDLIHYFNFDESHYDLGFDDHGRIITNILDDGNTTHFYDLQPFIKDWFNVPVEVFTEAHERDKDVETTWYIEDDGSVSGYEPNNKYFGVEVSTKTYPAYQWKSLFLNTMSMFEKYSLQNTNLHPETNKKTGLHFGVSFNDQRDLNFVKLIVLGQDPFWLKKVNREFNSYCKSQVKDILIHIETEAASKTPITMENVDNLIKNLQHKVTTEKYKAINFGHFDDTETNKYIEFRLAGNDYYNVFRQNNLRTIEWFLTIMVAAASKTLWETEYKNWLVSKYNSFIKVTAV